MIRKADTRATPKNIFRLIALFAILMVACELNQVHINNDPYAYKIIKLDWEEGRNAFTQEEVKVKFRLTDLIGNPQPNISIQFAVLAGDGSISGVSTDQDGVGIVVWKLGNKFGKQEISAEAMDQYIKTKPVSFSVEVNKFVDDRDAMTYHVVKIGHKYWMRENLGYGRKVYIPERSNLSKQPDNMLDNSISEKACCVDSESVCERLGGLYEWDELMGFSNEEKAPGLCPLGWHVPTEGEWKIAMADLGNNASQAIDTLLILDSGSILYRFYGSSWGIEHECGSYLKAAFHTSTGNDKEVVFDLRRGKERIRYDGLGLLGQENLVSCRCINDN